MKREMLWGLVGGCLTLTFGAGLFEAESARAVGVDAAEVPSMVAFSSAINDHVTQLILVDTRSRALAVYHVESTTGESELKSVRNVHWDLQIQDFNTKTPKPREIQSNFLDSASQPLTR